MNRQLFQDCGNVSGMHRYFKNMWILFHTLSSFKKFEAALSVLSMIIAKKPILVFIAAASMLYETSVALIQRKK